MTRKNPKGKHRKSHSAPTAQKSGGGAYWLVGRHALLAALGNDSRRILRVWLSKPPAGELAAALDLRKLKADIVDGIKLSSVTPGDTPHQGMAAEVLPLEEFALEDFPALQRVMVLDQVTDPHNVGAILRSCAAFGMDAIIMPKDNSPKETATMAKASSGAIEIIPIIKVTNLVAALGELKEQGFWVLGMDGTAEKTLYDAPSYDKVALVMGAEGEGMRRLTREHCDILVKLPISERMESLNVSNAAAIGLYELFRPR